MFIVSDDLQKSDYYFISHNLLCCVELNLIPMVFHLPTRGSGQRKTLVQARHVPW